MDERLTKRIERGRAALAACWGYQPEGDEDTASAAADTISDVLTALVGPAGHTVEAAPGIVYDQQAGIDARALLDRAYESWAGDAEDYDAPEPITVTVAAIMPENLLAQETARAVQLRSTGETGGAGGALLVDVTGLPKAVHAFIAEGWGKEEADDFVTV